MGRQGLSDALQRLFRRVERRANEDKQKLLPAVAADAIAASDRSRGDLTKYLQGPVACVMAVGIVDLLEWSMSRMVTDNGVPVLPAASICSANHAVIALRFARPVNSSR